MTKTTKEIWLETEEFVEEHDFIPDENKKWYSEQEVKAIFNKIEKCVTKEGHFMFSEFQKIEQQILRGK